MPDGEGVVLPVEARDELSGALANMAKNSKALAAILEKSNAALADTSEKATRIPQRGAGLLAFLKKAGDGFNKLNKFNVGQAIDGFKNLSVGGVALGASVLRGTKQAITYEKTIAQLGLSSSVTAKEIEMLDKSSRDLALTSSISKNAIGAVGAQLLKEGENIETVLAVQKAVKQSTTVFGGEYVKNFEKINNANRSFSQSAAEIPGVLNTVTKVLSETNWNQEELLSSLETLAPLARQSNVSLGETAAILGTLRDAGLSSSASTSAVSTAMSTTQSKLLGFKDGLALVGEAYQSTNSEVDRAFLLTQTFGDAGKKLVPLFEQTGGALDKLSGKYLNSAGALDKASQAIDKTTGEKFGKIKNRVDTAFQTVSEKYLPVINKLAGAIDSVPPEAVVAAVGGGQAILVAGQFSLALTSIVKMIGPLTTGYHMVGTALGVINVQQALATKGMLGMKVAMGGLVVVAGTAGFAFGNWLNQLAKTNKAVAVLHKGLEAIATGPIGVVLDKLIDYTSASAGRRAGSQFDAGTVSQLQSIGASKAQTAAVFSAAAGPSSTVQQKESIKELITKIQDTGMTIDKVEFNLPKGSSAEDVEKLLQGVLRRKKRGAPRGAQSRRERG